MARKMALIPAEIAQQSSLQQHTPTGPILNQLSLLDQQMKSVLDDVSIPSELKLQHYYNTLQRYSTLQDNAAHTPIPVRIEQPHSNRYEVPSSRELPVMENELLEHVPKTQRQTAKLLTKYIRENPDMSWNRNKELVYRGNVVPDSNIFDLVNDITRNRKHQSPARGWKQFTEALMNQNIPKSAVGNAQRWEYIVNRKRLPPEGEVEEPVETDRG